MTADVPDSLIEKLLSSFELTESGAFASGNSRHFDYIDISSLLLSRLLEDDNERFAKQLKQLRYTLPRTRQGAFPFRVAAAAKRENNTSYSGIKRLFEQFLNEKSQEPMRCFRCYIPVNVNFQDIPFNYRDDAIRISIHKFTDLPKITSIDDVNEILAQAESQGLHTDYSEFYVFECCVESINQEYAEAVSVRYVKFLLGLICIERGYHSRVSTIVGKIGAITDINHGLVFTFEGDRYIGASGYNLVEEKPTDHPVKPGHIEEINKLLKRFQTADEPVKDILIDAISVYHDGMTERRPGFAFLFFWTCAELLALKRAKLPEKQVKQRLRCSIKQNTPWSDLELNRLYSIRNDLAHSANYSSVSEHERNRMKWYVEDFILLFTSTMMDLDKEGIEKRFVELCENKKDADPLRSAGDT